MAARSFEVMLPAACKLRYYTVGMAAAVCDRLFCGWCYFPFLRTEINCNYLLFSVRAIFRPYGPKIANYYRHCRYLVYSEADFEVFCPAGATCCTDVGEIWHGGGDRRCNNNGIGPPKLKFLLRFHRNLEYKRSARAYPLRDFHKICRVCTSFQDALGVKIWVDLLKGLWSYGGFKLRVSGFPQIFSAP